MDAIAYLAGLGWKGEGHALQPSGRGLKKPLLASHKKDVLGLGKRKDDAITSQWWLDAFDKSLKGFDLQDKTTAPESLVSQAEHKDKEIVTQRVLGKYFDNGGLYGRFVSGDGLKGTLGIKCCAGTVPAELVEGEKAIDTDAVRISKCRKRKCQGKAISREASRIAGKSIRESLDTEAAGRLSKRKQRRKDVDMVGIMSPTAIDLEEPVSTRSYRYKHRSPEAINDRKDKSCSSDSLMPKGRGNGSRKDGKASASTVKRTSHINNVDGERQGGPQRSFRFRIEGEEDRMAKRVGG